MVARVNRRALLGLGMLGGPIVLTVASVLRKPPSYPVATPVASPDRIALQPLADIAAAPPRAVPSFGFQDGDGHPRTLADYAGRPVVLNLWATWCAPCVAELPALAALAADPAIVVLPLSTDRGGAAAVRRFLAAHAIDLPILADPTGESARVLGARGLPTTLVIDRQGRERARLEGAFDWASPDATRTLLALVA